MNKRFIVAGPDTFLHFCTTPEVANAVQANLEAKHGDAVINEDANDEYGPTKFHLDFGGCILTKWVPTSILWCLPNLEDYCAFTFYAHHLDMVMGALKAALEDAQEASDGTRYVMLSCTAVPITLCMEEEHAMYLRVELRGNINKYQALAHSAMEDWDRAMNALRAGNHDCISLPNPPVAGNDVAGPQQSNFIN